MSFPIRLALVVAAVLTGLLVVLTFEAPPMDSRQQGYRGTGMVQIDNPRMAAVKAQNNRAPEVVAAAAPGGEQAAKVYKNVQVLGDLTVAEFTRNMVAISSWVAPKESCNYCHDGANFESDAKYTKIVARRMLQMTRQINANWKQHVGDTGVTCYTCHRGEPVPSNVWFAELGPKTPRYSGNHAGQNLPASQVGLTSMPFDPFSPQLNGKADIRVAGTTALPTKPGHTIQDTERTYALMMHLSQALGVNCTFCHDTRSFSNWETSSPQRVTAYHGIHMVRDLNTAYLEPLKSQYPATRLGPLGDAPKANCATCHQGVSKPLLGAAMLKDHPELRGPLRAIEAAAAAPAPALATAPAATATPDPVLGRILFESAKTAIGGAGEQAIGAVVKAMQTDMKMKVDISGFADKTGNADQNLELAKQRAFAVRDALKAAGIGEERILLKKPEFVIGGAEAESRRVDIIGVR